MVIYIKSIGSGVKSSSKHPHHHRSILRPRPRYHHVDIETVLAKSSVGVPNLGPCNQQGAIATRKSVQIPVLTGKIPKQGVNNLYAGVGVLGGIDDPFPLLVGPWVSKPQVPYGLLGVGNAQPRVYLQKPSVPQLAI